jgi:hypothetical protein
MKLFNLPKTCSSNALEMYDPVRNERVNTSLAGMSGRYRKTIQSYHSIKEISEIDAILLRFEYKNLQRP